MTPTASIIVPTRDRGPYLDVALDSVCPQAGALGAEVIVVADGPDPQTAAVARAHGVRLVEHATGRGLNAARNSGIAAAGSDLLVFVDDDIAAHPGWLGALLEADRTLPASVGVLAGPIHARLEGVQHHTCGREDPPITTLDLGPHDGEARYAWGANLTVRRAAVDAVGPFDAALELYGDETEFQDRVRAAGMGIAYVAGAAVDHRRAGRDARLPALMRAAWRQGGPARREDVRHGRAPSLTGELGALLRCAAHGPLRRCAWGPVMAAHRAGRVRAALRAVPPAPAVPGESDFTSGRSGHVAGRRGALRRRADRLLDARLAADPRLRAARARAARIPVQSVTVIGVARPGMAMDAVLAELRRSRHGLDVRTGPPGALGKFANLNALLDGRAPDTQWLLLADDDIVLPAGFLDLFLGLAVETGLRIAQPAHRLHSHAAWPVTRRARGSLVRETAFVEIGPLTLLHRDTFGALVPFPDLGMGWGLDNHWSALARAAGWRMGVVDATPILHLHPAAAGYDRAAAMTEARAFLAGRPYVRREDAVTLRRLA